MRERCTTARLARTRLAVTDRGWPLRPGVAPGSVSLNGSWTTLGEEGSSNECGTCASLACTSLMPQLCLVPSPAHCTRS